MNELHKTFISFYNEDSYYKDLLIKMNSEKLLFVNKSVGKGEIDEDIKAETVRVKLRSDYIEDSTVLVLLCGKNTKKRKFIDWELAASMYKSETKKQLGILVINLPSSSNAVRKVSKREEEIVSNNKLLEWCTCTTRISNEKIYPDIPKRLIDNFIRPGVGISVVNWATIENNPNVLKELIDFAFDRRLKQDYNNNRKLRKHNS